MRSAYLVAGLLGLGLGFLLVGILVDRDEQRVEEDREPVEIELDA